MDFQTLYFLSMLNELAEKTLMGFVPWSACNDTKNFDSNVIYDDTQFVDDGGYPVVYAYTCGHDNLEITSYYSNEFCNYDDAIRVYQDKNKQFYIGVVISGVKRIVIQYGKWYFV